MKYENVIIDFVSAEEEPCSGRGSVITTDGNMTLEVSIDDEAPYVIRGIAIGGYFAGTSLDGKVKVEWGKVGAMFLGLWVEGGYEYFIRFRLPEGH